MRNYEDQAQRRARKVADIKEMFYRRLSEENRREKSARGTQPSGQTGQRGGDFPATKVPDTEHRGQMSAEPMSKYNLDAMNKVRGNAELNSGLMDEGERRFLSAKLGGDGRLLHLAHEACADESIKAGITLALAGLRVDGCFRFGTTELLPETVLPIVERGEVFFGGESAVVGSSIRLRIGGEKDALGLSRGCFEAVLTLQFLAGCGVAFPVTRMTDGVSLGSGLVDDATFLVAICFAAIDDAAFAKRTADVADGVFIIDSCHGDLRFDDLRLDGR